MKFFPIKYLIVLGVILVGCKINSERVNNAEDLIKAENLVSRYYQKYLDPNCCDSTIITKDFLRKDFEEALRYNRLITNNKGDTKVHIRTYTRIETNSENSIGEVVIQIFSESGIYNQVFHLKHENGQFIIDGMTFN